MLQVTSAPPFNSHFIVELTHVKTAKNIKTQYLEVIHVYEIVVAI